MTTLEADDLLVASSRKPGLFTRLWKAIERNRQQRASQRILQHLMHYDAHMLRDMGIDPRDIEDAFNRRSMSVLLYPLRPADRQ